MIRPLHLYGLILIESLKTGSLNKVRYMLMNNDIQNALLNASLNDEELKMQGQGTDKTEVIAPAAP